MIKEETMSLLHALDGVMEESDKEEELDSTKAQLEKVREENEKLKLLLSTILNDYNSLKMHVSNVLRNQQGSSKELNTDHQDKHYDFGVDISLRLGRSEIKISNKEAEEKMSLDKISNEKKRSALGLGFRIKSCDQDQSNGVTMKLDYLSRDVRNENAEINKFISSRRDIKRASSENQQEVLVEENEQAGLKKTRVCVKASWDDPSISDGCQWRKYGQKTAKTNPIPRAYYRCSMSNTCPVRKQMQRCGEDETSALMTTYEGKHDHSLPMEATHMAAGTSAAASLLQSTSSSSSFSSSLSYFFPFHHFSVSTTNSHPIVTLDLTRPNYPNQLSNYPQSSSLSLSFSSSDTPPPSSYGRTLSFSDLKSQAPLNLSSRTRLS